MGLDIVAYEFLKFHGDLSMNLDADQCEDQKLILIADSADFPGRLGGLKPGYYLEEFPTCTYHFRAGSYSTYGAFRNDLCRIMNNMTIQEFWADPEREDYAFYELLEFSDCEGIIAGKVAEKLYSEFWDNYFKVICWAADQRNLKPHVDDSPEDQQEFCLDIQRHAEDFVFRYTEWMKAFECAANKGALCFC